MFKNAPFIVGKVKNVMIYVYMMYMGIVGIKYIEPLIILKRNNGYLKGDPCMEQSLQDKDRISISLNGPCFVFYVKSM